MLQAFPECQERSETSKRIGAKHRLNPMCGLIAAFGDSERIRPGILRATQHMFPRGPDDEGIWQEKGACLGHRRLAVVDLDVRAAQPMHSACGRYVIVFNGECYNFASLRKELIGRGVIFATTSDTEVILALFASEGVAMLPRLHGMFAFVIWDRLRKRAFVARDSYGIKPLYWARTEYGVLIGSQVKALLSTGTVSREPDARGQAGFWMLGSVPEPRTWYQAIKALPSGHFAWVDDGRLSDPIRWCDIGNAWRAGPQTLIAKDLVQQGVRLALKESVSRHLVADVPVAVFLSGGIDSGALAGLMVELGAKDVEGVTIAFDDFAGSHDDEAPVAAAIASHYGIKHHVRRVTRDEFLNDVPQILASMDQPSIDGVNTWYASKAVAERGFKVVVSGVGGDELFQGYRSFQQLPQLVRRWKSFSKIPGMRGLGNVTGRLQARRSGNARWAHASEWMQTVGGAWWLRRSFNAPESLPNLMHVDLAIQALKGFAAEDWVAEMSGELPSDGRLALGLIESTTYLRNQLLRDSDWASMAHSIELRTPLVDSHMLNSLKPLLPSFFQHPGKRLLAAAPERALPPEISTRRKTGFGIPMRRWLSGETTLAGFDGSSMKWARRVTSAYENDV